MRIRDLFDNSNCQEFTIRSNELSEMPEELIPFWEFAMLPDNKYFCSEFRKDKKQKELDSVKPTNMKPVIIRGIGMDIIPIGKFIVMRDTSEYCIVYPLTRKTARFFSRSFTEFLDSSDYIELHDVDHIAFDNGNKKGDYTNKADAYNEFVKTARNYIR